MEEVDLRQAFEWTCDNCGQDHWERAIVVDPQSDEAKELMSKEYARQRKLAGITLDTEIVMAPSQVTCQVCGTSYKPSCTS